jgi:hypothetical protein
MADLITAAAPDLTWMRKVHRPDAVVLSPTQLLETRNQEGAVLIPEPHGLCVRDSVACVHRGLLPGVPTAPTGNLAAWAVQTFFQTAGLQPVRLLTRDGFERWVRDAPRPVVTVCTTCRGDGIDPDAKPDAEGVRPACSACHGEPRSYDNAGAAVEVGPVRVVLAELLPFLPHLTGASIGLGVAPAVGGTATDLELHVRHVTDDPASSGGAWRATLLAL